ncbi:hypothetical protein BS78_01G096000 [Paspalum vaginatum]|nr:hypothetical protein BS78_01G096000 [Paspalum vaginatum]
MRAVGHPGGRHVTSCRSATNGSKAGEKAAPSACSSVDLDVLSFFSSAPAVEDRTSSDPMLLKANLGSPTAVGPVRPTPATCEPVGGTLSPMVKSCAPVPVVCTAQSERHPVEPVGTSVDEPTAFADGACAPVENPEKGGHPVVPVESTVDEPLAFTDAVCSPLTEQAETSAGLRDEPAVEEFFASLQTQTSSLLPTPVLEPAREVSMPPLRSKRIAAQKLAGVPVAKRGELIVMKRLGYGDPVAFPSEDAVKRYNSICHDPLTAGPREAVSKLFPGLNLARPRRGCLATAVIA